MRLSVELKVKLPIDSHTEYLISSYVQGQFPDINYL